MKKSLAFLGSVVIGICLVIGLFWLLPGSAQAHSTAPGEAQLALALNPVVVGSGTPESCTRNALVAALGSGDNLYVTFNCGPDPVTIVFTARIDLQAGKTYVIDGGGLVTLDGNHAVGIFNVPATTALTLVELTVQRANCRGCGAINNLGTLEIRSSVLKDNARCCLSGAAVWAQSGSTTLISDTLVTGNANYDDAGGPMGNLYIASGAQMQVVHSDFSGNWTGAFYNEGSLSIENSDLHHHSYPVVQMGQNAQLSVSSSAFYSNTNTVNALNQSGRGAVIDRLGGAVFTVNIYDSTFEHNRARLDGGAIYAAGTLNIYNSIFFDNTVLDNGSPAGYGGAIRMDANGVISNTLFTENTAAGGGALSINAASVAIQSSQFLTNTSTSGGGGALLVLSANSLELTGSVFRNNSTSSQGGAGWLKASSLTVHNSLFENNRTGYWTSTGGGALYLEKPCCGGPKPNVTIADSQFTRNRAGSAGGGAIWTSDLNLDIQRGAFELNQADGGNGGALSLQPATQALIQDSLLAGNLATAAGGGGGVFLSGNASAALVNVTLSANEGAFGGGVARTPGGNDSNSVLSLYNVTLADGVARQANGGGNLQAHINGSTAIRNTIIAGGLANGAPNNCSAVLSGGSSQGYNLEDGSGCGLNAAGDQVNTDPLLTPLAATPGLEALPYAAAHLLDESSPAIDAGNPAGCFSDQAATLALDHDQRTAPRPADGDGDATARCDIGAVEYLIPNIPPTLAGPGTQSLPEDYPLAFSPAYQTDFALDDLDAGASVLRLRVEATHGWVTLGQAAGLTFLQGDGVGDAALIAEGTLADLQAALLDMYLTPLPDYTGAASLLVEVNDLSHPAAGGPGVATHVVPIFYSPVNDAPRLVSSPGGFLFLQEDQAFAFGGANRLELYDPDIYTGTLRVTLSMGTGAALTLASQQGLVFSLGDGITDTVMTWQATLTDTNAALDGMQLHLAPDFNGQTSLKVQAADGGLSGAGGEKTLEAFFSIFVAPVNDPPVHALPPAQTIPPNTDSFLYAAAGNRLAVSDVDVPTNTPISVTLRAENGTLALNPNVIGLNFTLPYTGDNAVISFKARIDLVNRALDGLRFRPTGGYSGPAAIQIASNDMGNTGGPAPSITTDSVPITVLGAPYVTFEREAYSAAESAGQVSLVVRLFNPNPAFSYQVSYAFTPETATVGQDYTGVDGVLNFSAGQTEQTIPFNIINDNIHEPETERLLVSLHSPIGALTLGEPAQATFDILNNDPQPVVRFAMRRQVVSEGDGTVQVVVTLDRPSQHKVRVGYLLASPDPLSLAIQASPDDYSFTPGTLNFAPGQTSQAFPLSITNDAITGENDEVIGLKLANPSNAVFGLLRDTNGLPTPYIDNQMTLVIEDDDIPSVFFQKSAVTFSEANSGGTGLIYVQLSAPSPIPVRVTCAFGGGTATRMQDYSVERLQTITFDPGQVLMPCTLRVLQDDLEEPLETFSVVLQNPQNARLDRQSPVQILASIEDDDTPPICVNFTGNFESQIQVVQTIQGAYTQNVPLVAGRQTFIRYSPSVVIKTAFPECRNRPPDNVKMDVYANGQRLEALNPRPLKSGWQGFIGEEGFNTHYWYELPAHMSQGMLNLVAEINADQAIQEENYTDNQISLQVSFTSPPPNASLVIYKVSYNVCPLFQPCTIIRPNEENLAAMLEMMRNHYPVNMNYQVRSAVMPAAPTKPSSNQVMGFLSGLLARDIASGATEAGTIYGGLIPDHAGIIGRRADNSTFKIAGMAVGLTLFVVDSTDGRTLMHELGHVQGRQHVDAPTDDEWMPCTKPEGVDDNYPYEDGLLGDRTRMFVGFNIQDEETYWYNRYGDIMTYCNNKWISDYTWQAIINFVGNLPREESTRQAQGAPGPVLLFSAIYDAIESQFAFMPLYVLPEAYPDLPPAASEYTLVLRGAGGVLLQSVPLEMRDNSAYEGGAEVLFTQAVALPAGVELLEVTGPSSALLGSIQASPNPPTLTLTAPLLFEQVSPFSAVLQPAWPALAPEILGEGNIALAWEAGDPDGDLLYFSVLFSPDDGQSWRTLATDLVTPTLTISRSQISASPAARLRVMASDGLHTVYADSGAFVVPNQPPDLGLAHPAPGAVFLVDQTIPLRAWVTDPDGDALDDLQISWTSDVSGLLGTGSVLPVQLAPGEHTITLRAVDSHGDASELLFTLGVVTDTALLPLQPTELRISPDDGLIVLTNQPGETAALINVYNLDYSTPISWTAVTTATWLTLSAPGGQTPDNLLVNLNHGLPFGEYRAELIISSPGDLAGGQEGQRDDGFTYVIQVYAIITPHQVYLPLLRR